MDQAAEAYATNFKGIQADVAELSRLGAPAPAWQLVAVNLDTAHDSALSVMGSKYVERLVPPTVEEEDRLDEALAVEPSSRLACQILMSRGISGLKVRLAPGSEKE